MPATQKKNVDPSHTIEFQRTVINDMAGDLQSLFVGTAAINAATIQIAGADIGAISDHVDKTIFFYYGGFTADTTISSAAKLAEVFGHEDSTVDIDDGVTVTVDDNCVFVLTPKTSYEFFSNNTEQTNIQKLTGFADNIRTSVEKDMALDGTKKVGFIAIPDYLTANTLSYHTPTAGTFAPTTGVMELTIGSHNLVAGRKIKIAPYSLTFTCSQDSHATTHTYPRTTDPYYNKDITITSVTSTTIVFNIGTTTAGNYTHNFISASNDAVYTSDSDVDDLSADIDDTFTLTVDDGAVLIV